jgi:hypothetical protein
MDGLEIDTSGLYIARQVVTGYPADWAPWARPAGVTNNIGGTPSPAMAAFLR